MSNRTFLTIAGAEARILDLSDPFAVSCTASGCAANCCTKSAPIILNPFEVSLISSESGMSYEDLLDIFDTDRARGFPLVMLPRDPSCHFWTGQGCRIYRGRPLACRLYPLGRVFDNGASHIVHPLLNICSGLSPSPSPGTVSDYFTGQDVALQIRMADIWIDFVSSIETLPLEDAPVTSVAFHMLVYSPDTPPAPGNIQSELTPAERFILRLKTAREELPRLLKLL